MKNSLVTIIIVPRERFSYSQSSLENIYTNTSYPFDLIYVDGGSPQPIQKYLEHQAQQKCFTLIRTKDYLSPNKARNIGIAEVKTKYVVFLDNDVLVKPGWLKSLVDCAEEHGAWAVGPLCLQGEDFKTVHITTGTFEFRNKGNQRWLIERRPLMRMPLEKVSHKLEQQSTQLIEFHCMLARSEMFEKYGLLDEELLSMAEESDLCLRILETGNSIYFEPSSIVSYIPPSKLEHIDKPYFMLRWSDDWCTKSIEHFHEKWNLTEDSLALKHFRDFVSNHRNGVIKSPKYRVEKALRQVVSRIKKEVGQVMS